MKSRLETPCCSSLSFFSSIATLLKWRNVETTTETNPDSPHSADPTPFELVAFWKGSPRNIEGEQNYITSRGGCQEGRRDSGPWIDT
jgi:hypothetical protein